MADIKADTIGLETGTYLLNCGCRIYVHFPGGHIHLSHGWAQCPELARLWRLYERACAWAAVNPHSWDALTRYLFCLRHVGAWPGRIARIENLRSRYRSPADARDYQATVTLTKQPQHTSSPG